MFAPGRLLIAFESKVARLVVLLLDALHIYKTNTHAHGAEDCKAPVLVRDFVINHHVASMLSSLLRVNGSIVRLLSFTASGRANPH